MRLKLISSHTYTVRGLVRFALALAFLSSSLAPVSAAPQRTGRRTPPRRPAASAPQKPAAQRVAVPANYRVALEAIDAASLRGHLSFLASNELEGRATPSRGLDIAAEYIAAQMRRYGLEPAGHDGSYFQTANWMMSGRAANYRLDLNVSGGGISVGPEHSSLGLTAGGMSLWMPEPSLSLDGTRLLKLAYGDAEALAALTREKAEGRVVVTEIPSYLREGRERAFALLREQHDFLIKLRALGVPLVISFDRQAERGRGAGQPRLINPDSPARSASPFGGEAAALITLYGEPQVKFYDALPAGETSATLTFRSPAEVNSPVAMRNVAALLRGSDPGLREEYVVVSAHYDHLGIMQVCGGRQDCIYNGANDNGSGTVGVIELASALARLKTRPKRSLLFLAFFGEERGLLGSRYYGRRPLVPLAQTVAQINLEQIGRTDDSEGAQVAAFAVTGFDFSDIGATLESAGALVGIRAFMHPTNSDAYFSRSDNQALADLGVPAHTISTTYQFPDYHGVGDEWEKIDYENMARVLRAVALGVLRIADAPQPPRWNESNPKTSKYVEAWRGLRSKGEEGKR